MKLKVTQEHIARARARGNPGRAMKAIAFTCPIAQAMKDEGYIDPCVAPEKIFSYTSHIVNGRSQLRVAYFLPSRAAIRFMKRFDDGKEVEPTTFIFKPSS